ncbi:MAG: hypothetical protein MNPFHGCM_00224 [Gemmatimonadaceae bacterium]|nr:hypothetical protein [Gemmatimonadaceae bacterium]
MCSVCSASGISDHEASTTHAYQTNPDAWNFQLDAAQGIAFTPVNIHIVLLVRQRRCPIGRGPCTSARTTRLAGEHSVMRKLFAAGLATLLLVAVAPTHLDAQRRGRGAAKAAKAGRSGGTWSQPTKAASKKKSSPARKGSVGVTAKLPQVSVPAAAGSARRGRPSINTGSPSSASLGRTTPKISVDYTPDPETKKTPKLVNGGLGGSGNVKRGGGGGGGGGKKSGARKGKRG